MQMAWRERNPQARIKAAHDALEKNAEYVVVCDIFDEERKFHVVIDFTADKFRIIGNK